MLHFKAKYGGHKWTITDEKWFLFQKLISVFLGRGPIAVPKGLVKPGHIAEAGIMGNITDGQVCCSGQELSPLHFQTLS